MKKALYSLLTILSVLALASQACTISLFKLPTFPTAVPSTPGVDGPTSTPQPKAQTTFTVTLPEPLAAGETLILSVLDEVTGLQYNPTSYPMQAVDGLTYSAVLPLTLNAVVKYRYIRRGAAQVVEDSSLGFPVRYRLYYVSTQGEVRDTLSDWSDKSYARELGSIQGRAFNADTGAPIPNLLISANGVQYLTDSAGRFDIQGLPAGTHNLVAYALDGMYQTFQQGATVGVNQTTSVELRLHPAQMVNVTFSTSVPDSTVTGAPIRLAGSLLKLGNTFGDLQGGMNTSADRMPLLSFGADGRYTTTLNLPVGAYIQYKYTLGDGFWNAEHDGQGKFMLRELVVPDHDVTVQDAIATWQAGNSAPILFEVTVPASTPAGDIIYIQINPYTWTEPLPMWPLGNNKWSYKLYGPLNMLGSFGYRFCRDAQCGSADDIATIGSTAAGRQAITNLSSQDIQDNVSAWNWYENVEPTTLVGAAITPRPQGFMAGIELQADYQPNWSYYMPQALANIQALGANQLVLTPTWSYGSANPLTFGPVPGRDVLWSDSADTINQARALGMNVSIFPAPRFNSTAADFWKAAPRDAAWWQNWFDHYRAFAVNYADLAAQTGAQTLILGGDWLAPALPNGTLSDGSPSGAPADLDIRWKAIVTEVRAHFSGRILWALPFTQASLQAPLTFLQDTDGIYLLWSAPLTGQANASKADLANEAGRLLDNEVAALPALINKPIILAVAYPSATGAATGCISNGAGACLDWTALSRPNPDSSAVSLNLQLQADLYEAVLTAVNGRPWISGVVSRGYYPPAALRDKSASVHGKPAADILWYWYPRLTGVVK
jgi:hypothetical protein